MTVRGEIFHKIDIVATSKQMLIIPSKNMKIIVR